MASFHHNRLPGRLRGIISISLILIVFLGGCATQKQARSVEVSGFLGDYSNMKRGGPEEPFMSYRNPDTDWASYKKVILDPVVFYQKVEDPSKDTHKEDIRTMMNNFSVMIANELKKDYTLVNEPGPDVMRIQVALTDVEKSHAVLQLITSVVPVGIVISTTKNFITGKPSFVGEATVEFRITDSQSGKILGEAVDRRVGGQMIKTSFGTWVDANNIMEKWAQHLRYRLCKLRDQKDCRVPN